MKMERPTVTVPQKRRGRPSLDDEAPSTSVHLRLSARKYDELYAQARRERLKVPELIRRELDRAQPNKKT